jgi:hypothetical protein
MASTTTNYGFDVPTSSDLVKNGATQIALLGQDLDTFLFRPFTKNAVLNSAFQIWQRGTSFLNPANGYTADRWLGSTAAAGTVSRQVTGDTTNLPNIQYCLRYQRTAASTSTATLNIAQSFETVNSISFAGKAVTFSFYARAGANYSAASNALVVQLVTGTGTDQNFYTAGYTGSATPINTSVTLTTTWQRFTVTGTIAATATELGVYFQATPVGTAGAADYYEVTGIQLEVGSQATPFTTATGTIQGELAACQRYYYRTIASTALRYTVGYNNSASTSETVMPFPVTMRTAPTALEQSGTAADYGLLYGGIGALCTSVPSFVTAGNSQINFNFTVPAASLTIGAASIFYAVTANGYLGWSAEL